MKRLIGWIGIACAIASTPVHAEPIRIGAVGELSGANAETGNYQLNGIKLAIEEINKAGGVLGRPLELDVQDNQSANPGSVLAFSKLVAKHDIAAVIGPIRSTQVLAMMPSILKAGIPVMVGGTDYTLTHANNPWIFRVRPHDGYSANAIADFGVNTLKLKKWVIVHSTETFGIGGKNRLTDILKSLGVSSILSYGVRNNTQDLSLIVQSIKQSDADILATYITAPENVIGFAKSLRQGGITVPWIGSPSVVTATAVQRGGSMMHDTYSITDFFVDASPEAQAFSRKYRNRYGLEPDIYSAWTYDAVNLLALAIKNANSTAPEEIRKAILSIQQFKGVEGIYGFDQSGDGLHGYNIVKNEQGKIIFIKRIEFQQ